MNLVEGLSPLHTSARHFAWAVTVDYFTYGSCVVRQSDCCYCYISCNQVFDVSFFWIFGGSVQRLRPEC